MLKPRTVGRTGLNVSALCLGTNHFGGKNAGCDEETAHTILDTAIEAGINFIDTANVYGNGASEQIIGNYFKKSGKRDDIIVATKLGYTREGYTTNAMGNRGGPSRYNIICSVEDTLRRLQCECIDVLYLHTWFDPQTLEETLWALDHLIRQGKVMYVGCSNFPTWLLARALWLADVRAVARFDLVQSVYNALLQDIAIELIPFAQQENVAVVTYSPLASGVLTGKHPRQKPAPIEKTTDKGMRSGLERLYFSTAQQELTESFKAMAKKHDVPLTALALNWTLNSGATCCIVGARTPAQLKQTLDTFQSEPSTAVMAEFKATAENYWDVMPLRYPPPLGESFVNMKPIARAVK